jgi:hypothetical protein
MVGVRTCSPPFYNSLIFDSPTPPSPVSVHFHQQCCGALHRSFPHHSITGDYFDRISPEAAHIGGGGFSGTAQPQSMKRGVRYMEDKWSIFAYFERVFWLFRCCPGDCSVAGYLEVLGSVRSTLQCVENYLEQYSRTVPRGHTRQSVCVIALSELTSQSRRRDQSLRPLLQSRTPLISQRTLQTSLPCNRIPLLMYWARNRTLFPRVQSHRRPPLITSVTLLMEPHRYKKHASDRRRRKMSAMLDF